MSREQTQPRKVGLTKPAAFDDPFVGAHSTIIRTPRVAMSKIQWFPGHMHKARVQMAEILPKVDLVIEVLDARIPYSSENPMLSELRGDKPALKLLNKSDLADPELTKVWKSYLDRQPGIKARPVTTEEPKKIWQLGKVIQDMFPEKQGMGRFPTAMICGIPNVGKSTLINILAGRKSLKTGDEPGVTKGQQKIKLQNGVMLYDTPGVLWPNVENIKSGYRLATMGSIKDTAMEYEDVAHFAAGILLESYVDRLVDRYQIDPLPETALELMDAIGKRRGCLSKRAIVDYERVSRILLTDLRSGKLGPITFETPEMMEAEKREVEAEAKAKAEKKAGRDKERKARFKARQNRGEGG